jgi:methyl-accepting chemotaxis protein
MALQQLSVRARLGGGFGLVLALLLGVVVTALVQLATFNRNVEGLANTRLVQLITVAQVSNTVGHTSRSTGNVLVLDEEKQAKDELAQIRANQGAMQELLAKVQKMAGSEREQALFADIANAHAAYVPHENEFLKIAEHGDYSSAKDLLLKSMRPEQLRLIEAMERYEDHQVALSVDDARKAADAYVITRNAIFALSVAAVALGILLAWRITRSITRPIQEAVEVAQRVASGDLTVHVRPGGRDEMGRLLHALGGMTTNLRGLVGEVAGGARVVADTSAQIAQGNLDLSQRTEEQAGTLEETASSMEELTATVTQNAGNARSANQLAGAASDVARRGGEAVGQVVSTMQAISESSRRIADIIGVIDGIAFQTNILALNAAVEAARAGDQGRGFAVVASEVRNLAQRSAAAAKEIKSLIVDSVDKVETGARQVGSAGKTMDEIVAAVTQVSDLISEIAAASDEQRDGIEQVNRAVAQMDQVVQQNASLVEESSAATEAMKAQAASLLHTVSRFRISEEEHPASQPQARPQLPGAVPPVVAPIRVRARALPPANETRVAPQPAGDWHSF